MPSLSRTEQHDWAHAALVTVLPALQQRFDKLEFLLQQATHLEATGTDFGWVAVIAQRDTEVLSEQQALMLAFEYLGWEHGAHSFQPHLLFSEELSPEMQKLGNKLMHTISQVLARQSSDGAVNLTVMPIN